MRRRWRILILLLVFALVAGVTLWERLWVRSGARPLAVAIYPVVMDAASAAFVAKLQPGDFQEIAGFLANEAQQHWHKDRPAPRIELMAPVRELPPLDQAHSRLEAIQYSLRLRWYAFRHSPFWASLGTVRLFVLYHEMQFNQSLPHSLGLQKGLLGVVHVFASERQQAQNNFVITHELLHTLGATDKYDATGQPRHPAGYADPFIEPRLPQQKAEIMAGRIPVTASKAEIPKGLDEAVIGYVTASEIGW
jgi:hypothetical protein